MRALAAPPAALLLLASTLVVHSRAQIYTFENTAIPANGTLHTIYAFYVYSLDESPEKAIGAPFVKFSNLVASSTSPTRTDADADLKAYKSLQVTLMRYRDFWTLVNPTRFCSEEEDVKGGLAETEMTLLVNRKPGQALADLNVYPHTVRFFPNGDSKKTVTKTGVYVLAVSNCGFFEEATMSGSIVVKNPYGFLPGVEYHKMPFYGTLAIVYGLLAACWLILSLRWWKETFAIQNCIAGVIALGLLECFMWYITYSEWNASGKRGTVMFVLTILVTVTKSCFSYMLVLVAALGWGVTRPFLDADVLRRVQAVSVSYIILSFTREYVLSYRHSHSLSMAFVIGCLVPMSAINGAIFYWVFSALSSLIVTLNERKQSEKAQIFQRLWTILIVSISLATVCLLFQVADVSRSDVPKWRYQWFFTDGVSHLIFLFVLMAMMYLWAPHKNSLRYAYSAQVDKDDIEQSKNVWADEDDVFDDGNDDGDSFWAQTKGNDVAAETIGADSKGTD